MQDFFLKTCQTRMLVKSMSCAYSGLECHPEFCHRGFPISYFIKAPDNFVHKRTTLKKSKETFIHFFTPLNFKLCFTIKPCKVYPLGNVNPMTGLYIVIVKVRRCNSLKKPLSMSWDCILSLSYMILCLNT